MAVMLLLSTLRIQGVHGDQGQLPNPTAPAAATKAITTHQWLSDEVIHDNWRRLIRRRVQLVSNKVLDFEIVQQKGPDQAVLIFVWNTATQSTTLIREYMPARKVFGYGLAAGMVDAHHPDTRSAALAELAEECQLTCGTRQNLVLLTPPEGVMLDKYCSTKMLVYLAIDPTPCQEEVARDEAEEGMEVVHGVTIYALLGMLREGELTVVASWAVLLALRKLQELGYINSESEREGL